MYCAVFRVYCLVVEMLDNSNRDRATETGIGEKMVRNEGATFFGGVQVVILEVGRVGFSSHYRV